MWGSWTQASTTGLKTVFLVGVSNSIKQQRLIEEESHTHHDIIQVDFIDSYKNLTLKTLTMLHWTITYCPKASWLLKSDEDVVIDSLALRNALTHHKQADFLCYMNRHLWVCRSGGCPQKWVVSLKEYQHSTYPPYCMGFAYVVSYNMAEKLFAFHAKICKLERQVLSLSQ